MSDKNHLSIIIFSILLMLIIPLEFAFTDREEIEKLTGWKNERKGYASYNNGKYEILWKLNGTAIDMAILAATGGWVAIGFSPEQAMQGADIVMGFVEETGKAKIFDMYSTGPYGPHPPDTELGGKDNISLIKASKTNGKTFIAFERKLNTGDRYDKPIPENGKIKIIWSFGDSLDTEAIHVERGYGEIDTSLISTASTGKKENQPYLNTNNILLYSHITLMSLAFVLMLTGIVITIFYKRKRWRIKAHKSLGITSAMLLLSGFTAGYFFVKNLSDFHFSNLHTIWGLSTVIIVTLTPIMGNIFLKSKSNKKLLRIIHTNLGRISVTAIAINIILGLLKAGIL